MTTAEPKGHAPLRIEQEEDAPDIRKVAVICVSAVAIFAVGIAWVLRILADSPPTPDADRSVPRELGRPKIGMVLQTPFEEAKVIEQGRRDAKQRLGSYGWVDRDKGVIHIPIERAMELEAEEGTR